MVASYCVVPYVQRCYAWVVMSSAAGWRCTQLLKVLHKCCNTYVLGVLLIYPHSPFGTMHPRESSIYISQTPHCCVTLYLYIILLIFGFISINFPAKVGIKCCRFYRAYLCSIYINEFHISQNNYYVVLSRQSC